MGFGVFLGSAGNALARLLLARIGRARHDDTRPGAALRASRRLGGNDAHMTAAHAVEVFGHSRPVAESGRMVAAASRAPSTFLVRAAGYRRCRKKSCHHNTTAIASRNTIFRICNGRVSGAGRTLAPGPRRTAYRSR